MRLVAFLRRRQSNGHIPYFPGPEPSPRILSLLFALRLQSMDGLEILHCPCICLELGPRTYSADQVAGRRVLDAGIPATRRHGTPSVNAPSECAGVL